MKLITLNTWGGRAGKEELLNFFSEKKDVVDIFCLQEIWAGPYAESERTAGGLEIDYSNILVYGRRDIAHLLPEYHYYFHPHHKENYGLMMLLGKTFEIKDHGDIFVHKHRGYLPEGDIGHHARNIQYAMFEINGKSVTVINFHGLWNGKGKTDSEDRLKQSDNIVAFLKTIKGEIILCGDFNLLPTTESLKKIEAFGLRNLISENGVTSTRTSFYKKPDTFADYVFVSNGITVNEFRVLPDEVSDHSPLLLDFEV